MLAQLLKNKHTSGAAVAFIVGAGLSELGPQWLPAYAQQFQHTGKWLQGIAGMYGLAMAGDAKASPETQQPPK